MKEIGNMEGLPQPEVDPEAKQKINEEGWEGNAAVLIGKNGQEMADLKEKLESEGRAKDPETFIRLNKQIVVTQREMEALPVLDMVKPGFAFFASGEAAGELGAEQFHENPEEKFLVYMDQNQNIARVPMELSRIATYKDISGPLSREKKFIDALTELGFDLYDPRPNYGQESSKDKQTNTRLMVNVILDKLQQEVARQEAARREGFDF